MPWPGLPVDALPAWALLNAAVFHDVKIATLDGRGCGLVCDRNLSADGTHDPPTLLSVPHSLVLNAKAVEEYAKEDRNFKHLLDIAGHNSTRDDILLFLLVQMVLASRAHQSSVVGVSNPWTEYIKFLPQEVLVPTLWTEDERLLLKGTSLESAVNAKITALTAEFDKIQETSSDIPCWNDLLWQSRAVSLRDWILLDALYRSRCLELPTSGESMVPCIDMVNHSTSPNAFYDENGKDETVLLLRPGITMSAGDEVTISYGEAKSAAEMLFSYGFIDPDATAESLVLTLAPFPDDPLARAKLVAFGEPPKIHVARNNGSIQWESSFAYLMCVNEEDGLDFRVLQDTEGNRQLRVFWQDEDVTDQAADFESLIQSHELFALLRLRVVTVVQERLQDQLDRLKSSPAPRSLPASDISTTRDECARAASLLRQIETSILEASTEALEKEVSGIHPAGLFLASPIIQGGNCLDASSAQDSSNLKQ
ncbi:hypothetical protein B0T19DRAFT_165293 [Cercophora scortea]|uniref:SET domain-containing protein n=1 Tax=Cercophora scortea TaxID=314031 RepID=A0AAE0MCI7_9PEZI|nr:hypothetical protein B0T19DRAFT_165293 [Cercophora scortea]